MPHTKPGPVPLSKPLSTPESEDQVPLTVVIITKNEELNLQRCLESVAWAKERLVLDSGSTDRTLEIARQCGARVETKAWLGFGAQKALGASLAKTDWILSLDADERVTAEMAAEIRASLPNLDPSFAYSFPRRSYVWNRWIQHGGWSPDRQIRLFQRTFSNWDASPIHEKVVAKQVLPLNSSIDHFVFRDLAHQIETNNRYSGLLAAKDHAEGKTFSVAKLVIKPWVKFIENYFLKAGFLDGLPGFVIAVNSAHSTFLRWFKIWEIERRTTKAETQ